MSTRVLAGRYELIEAIGWGGMGTVWRANDAVLPRQVAVKEVRLPEGVSPERRAELLGRTMREGRICAGLSHPSVIKVHDIIQEDEQPWLVMELVHGRGLDRVVAEDGPLESRRVAAIGQQLVAALDYAHAAGVLHRDVKPANVLLGARDHATLTDFGIATREGEAKLTITGKLPGAAGYVAPERMAGEQVRPESDLWSLGATLYYAVEGRSPFQRSTQAAQIIAPMTDAPDPPQRAGPLTQVLEGLLHRDPDQRLRGTELDNALLAVIEGRHSSDMAPTTLDLSRFTGPRPSLSAESRSTGYGNGSPNPAIAFNPTSGAHAHPTAGHAGGTSGGTGTSHEKKDRTPWRRYVLAILLGLVTLVLAPLLVEFLSSQWF